MSFSRQHYQKFAELLKRMKSKSDKELFANALIQLFKADNPRFDAERFIAAINENTQLKGTKLSPTGGKKSFRINESFEKLGMKLVELLPTGKIEGRKTFVREAPISRNENPNEKILVRKVVRSKR